MRQMTCENWMQKNCGGSMAQIIEIPTPLNYRKHTCPIPANPFARTESTAIYVLFAAGFLCGLVWGALLHWVL